MAEAYSYSTPELSTIASFLRTSAATHPSLEVRTALLDAAQALDRVVALHQQFVEGVLTAVDNLPHGPRET